MFLQSRSFFNQVVSGFDNLLEGTETTLAVAAPPIGKTVLGTESQASTEGDGVWWRRITGSAEFRHDGRNAPTPTPITEKGPWARDLLQFVVLLVPRWQAITWG